MDNIRAIREDLERNGEGIWGRFNRPRVQQKWYYENLAAVFTDRLTDEQSRNLLDLFKAEVARVFGDVPHEVNGQIAMNKPSAALTEQDVLNIMNLPAASSGVSCWIRNALFFVASDGEYNPERFKKYIEQDKQVVGGNLWQTRDNPMSRAIRMT